MRVMLRIGTPWALPQPVPFVSHSPHPLHRTCQLGIHFGWIPGSSAFKYSNSATELLGDLVAQLIRAWQAICQVVGSSPALSSLVSGGEKESLVLLLLVHFEFPCVRSRYP